ncbi:MAG TPA: hypothetical protein VKB52_01190 [Rhodanobacteraceae bacterium]|nr:hypothetical protein [Rhodanobacteraceae bacterium]
MTPIALVASLALAAGAGETVSTTPYATLYQVLAPVRAIEGYDRLVAIQRVESKIDTPAKDIRIVIHAKNGPIPVAVAADGEVTFPVTDALREENPPVETNQPKGSLALIVNVALRGADKLRVPWSDIEAGLGEVRTFYEKSKSAATAPAVSGIEVYFAGGGAAMLTIEGKGERLLMADPNGRIIVTRDMAPPSESPTLVFSRAPAFVLPYSDEKK